MRQISFILISAFLTVLASSCNSANNSEASHSDDALPVEDTIPTSTYQPKVSRVKFALFNNVEDVRQRLSAVGIGELGRWRDDDAGGFMSATSYYEFGGGNLPNNLAYYLESDNSNSIKTVKLVLNINDGNKKPALSRFTESVNKTYKALGLTPTNKVIAAAKNGKEVVTDKSNRTEGIKLEKSRIETWQFEIATK